MDEETILQQRKEKVILNLKKGYNWIFYVILAAIVFIAFKIRTLNLPRLRDSTTGGWALGPDLDPWLFTRYAKEIVETGTLSVIDMMRYVPIGYETKRELLLHPYLMAWFHKIAVLFGSESVVQSSALYPAFMFALTVVAFFFFARKIFIDRLGERNSNIIALIASVFLSIIPILLPRTIAGIPEKESAAFLFLFLAFYLFLSAWKSEKLKSQITLGILSGLATAAMGLIWGGVGFIFFTIGPFILVTYFLGKLNKGRILVSLTWLIFALGVMSPFATRYSVLGLLTSTSIGLGVAALVSAGIEKTPIIRKIKQIDNPLLQKIPSKALAFFVTIIIIVIALSIFIRPTFVIDEINGLTRTLINPITDRLGVTVAENRQPFFTEWSSSFGPVINGFPIFFLLFLAGSGYLFYSMLGVLSRKEKILGTLGYITFLFALIFSRYAPSFISATDTQGMLVRNIYFLSGFIFIAAFSIYQLFITFKLEKEDKSYEYSSVIPSLLLSIVLFLTLTVGNENGKYLLNGTNPVSLFVYLSGPLILFFFLAKKGLDDYGKTNLYSASFAIISGLLFINAIILSFSWIYYLVGVLLIPFAILTLIGIMKQHEFSEIDLGIIMLFIFFFLSIVTARGAIRITMVLVPSAAIIASYFIVSSFNKARRVKSQGRKIIAWALVLVIIWAALVSANSFYKTTKSQAENFAPGSYNFQWQRAMSFVRENTPENAVFGHWWDYGYWIQSIGERATVLDGGNAVGYWNHLMGRHALTGPDNQIALDFLFAHGTTHFLIDSTDIGKYGAFSSIGSDENFDRASQIPVFHRDNSQTAELSNSTVMAYNGGFPVESDILYELNGQRIFLPAGKAIIAGILVSRSSDTNVIIEQPQAVFFYQNQRYNLPIRYAFDSEFRDFGSGVEYGFYPIPRISTNDQGGQIEEDGALLFLSDRTVKSQLARLYLYKENNPNFKLINSQDDLFVEQVKASTPGFSHDVVFFQGIRGPIRIWEINYPQGMEVDESYLQTSFPDPELAAAN
ncbi:hypothetical protein CMI45_00025 [Candidatus Pacearchaeota archaeon]|nr:hypothetical protein [Candidatus Pacearchaeota archaeon]|tara:strand:+ start:1858 stop:4914 length:3057 start_codon:yes stop_codon:yes gene_type:complete